MASGSNRKESPTEPFKRALGLTVRAIAGDDEVQVSYAPGKPEIEGKLVQLPEPSRVPSLREVAVIRAVRYSGADGVLHYAPLHRRWRQGLPARPYSGLERARIGSRRQNAFPSWPQPLGPRRDHYARRYAEITERADAPLRTPSRYVRRADRGERPRRPRRW